MAMTTPRRVGKVRTSGDARLPAAQVSRIMTLSVLACRIDVKLRHFRPLAVNPRARRSEIVKRRDGCSLRQFYATPDRSGPIFTNCEGVCGARGHCRPNLIATPESRLDQSPAGN